MLISKSQQQMSIDGNRKKVNNQAVEKPEYYIWSETSMIKLLRNTGYSFLFLFFFSHYRQQ